MDDFKERRQTTQQAARPQPGAAATRLVWRAAAGLALTGVLAFLACAWTASSPRPEPGDWHRTQSVAGAGAPLGAERCDLCHGQQPAPRHHADCESCHGSGKRHVQNVLDLNGIRFPSNADCLACHETGHRGLLNWSASDHERAGVLCSDCHDPHDVEPFHLRTPSRVAQNVLPQARLETRVCMGCHLDVAAKLNLPSHHPVREGMLGCSDCHEPHGSSRTRLGAGTARCTGCHQAQAGPWIYEHTPVAEDCGYCHVPHGAAANDLLVANEPGACVYCHSLAEFGAVHDPQAYTNRCTECHGAVHGSYSDPHLRR